MTAQIISLADYRAARSQAATSSATELAESANRLFEEAELLADPRSISIERALTFGGCHDYTVTARRLRRLGVETLYDLSQVTVEWLLSQKGIGHGTRSQAHHVLRRYGLSFMPYRAEA